MVSKKLKVKEFEEWVNHELDGYGDTPYKNYPPYRFVQGTAQTFNPFNGNWIEIVSSDRRTWEVFSQKYLGQSVSEVEHLLENNKGRIQCKYTPEETSALMEMIGKNWQVALKIPTSTLSRILDSTRNVVLKWALQLEEDGILGDGLTFTKEEVTKAQSNHYTINYFAGDVNNSQVQQGATSSFQRKGKDE